MKLFSNYISAVVISENLKFNLGIIIMVLITAGIAFLMFIVLSEFFNKRYPKNRRKVKIDRDYYFKEIPLDGHLPALFFFDRMRGLSKPYYRKIIIAYFMKWINEESIKPMYREDISQSEENKREMIFRLEDDPESEIKFEVKLWEYIYEASGDDLILDRFKFKNFSESYNVDYKYIIYDIFQCGLEFALERNLIRLDKGRFIDRYYLTDSGKEALRQVKGFNNYLDKICSKEKRFNDELIQNIEIWDEYIIISSLFGKERRIISKMKKLRPDYNFKGADNIGIKEFYTGVYNIFKDLYRVGIKSLIFTFAEVMKNRRYERY